MKSLLSDIRNFFEGNFLFFRQNHNQPHINEQAEWRAFLCSDCFRNGKCRHCGCKTPNMFFSPHKTDSEGKWGQMMSASEWENFKKSNVHYRFFQKAKEDKLATLNNANTQQLRHEHRLLGSQSTTEDSVQESTGAPGQQQDNVGDQSNLPSGLQIQQSTLRRSDTSD